MSHIYGLTITYNRTIRWKRESATAARIGYNDEDDG